MGHLQERNSVCEDAEFVVLFLKFCSLYKCKCGVPCWKGWVSRLDQYSTDKHAISTDFK